MASEVDKVWKAVKVLTDHVTRHGSEADAQVSAAVHTVSGGKAGSVLPGTEEEEGKNA